jgi:DNA invertase Pin-like site-specific DNA recombinase
VSGKSQDLAAQLADLKAAGCERIYREKISAETAERPQLKKLLAVAAGGDVVIISATDRTRC